MTPDDIEALSSYRGRTPLPDDFDEFWDARMKEADAVPLEWRVEPSEMPPNGACEYLDLWFCGMGGALLYAKYLRPAQVEAPPVVLQFHGYPGATRSWFEQASFVGMGCAVIALDNPGQGGKSQDVGGFMGTTVAGHLVAGIDGGPENLYYVRLYQDLRILCRIVRELGTAGSLDLGRVYVNGGSQGGGMGIACCALNPGLIAKAAILYPFLSDFRKVYELGADEVAYEGIRYYARWFDPDGTREDEWFGTLAYIETNHFAHLVRCPVLFGTGLDDEICPPETQCAVYNDLACEKRRLLYPGFGHEEIQDFDDQILAFFGEAAVGEGEAPYMGNPHATYETVRATPPLALGEVELRLVVPSTKGPHPVVLMFHDLGRPPRGWFHLTRYVGAGFAVAQLSNRPDADGSQGPFLSSCGDALAAFMAIADDPRLDGSRIIVFGEGYGGALALDMASQMPRRTWKAAALNPYPLGLQLAQGRGVASPTLLGTCLMDEVASPAEQARLAQLMPHLRWLRYPKYAHERVNAFENEFLAFIYGQGKGPEHV